MSLFSKLFSNQKAELLSKEDVKVDMHSHMIPGIDDGAQTLNQSLILVNKVCELGFSKLICTPHIMQDYYKNSKETILPAFESLQNEIVKSGLKIELDFAAEYYLDEWLINEVNTQPEKLLNFGDKYILIETSFMNKPAQMEKMFFILLSKGYKPVLAHPERYTYAYDNFEIYDNWIERGILLQLNTTSITGYYSKMAQKASKYLIDKKYISFIGTDCHTARHLDRLEEAKKSPLYSKLINHNPLLNNSLL